MRATGRGSSFRSTGAGSALIWVYAAVLLLGALAGCTDQSGSKGPTPSTTSGGKSGGELAALTLLIQEGPGGDQFTITVVARSVAGAPLDNRQVFMSTTSGTLSRTQGLTDFDGRFVSVLTCGSNFTGAATVTAFVEGSVKTISAPCK